MAAILNNTMNFPAITQVDPSTGASMAWASGGLVKGCNFQSRLYQSQNANGSIGSSQALVDFIITNQSDLHSLSDVVIEFTIANGGTGGNVAYFLPTPYLLQNFQYLSNNAVQETFYPPYMFSTICSTYPAMALKTILPLMSASAPNAAAAYNSSGVVSCAGGATTKLYLPLTPFIWLCNGVLLPQVRSEQRIRLNINPSSMWTWSDSTSVASQLTITNIQMYGSGLIYAGLGSLDRVTAAWQKSTHLFPRLSPSKKDISLGSLSTSTTSGKLVLNSVAGAFSGCLVEVQELNGADNDSQLVPITADIQFYSASGAQINYLNVDKLQRYQQAIQFPMSEASAPASYRAGSYFVPFVLSYNNALKNQQCCSGLNFTGSESITVKPVSASLTNGQVTIHMSQAAVYAVLPLSGIVTYTPLNTQAAV